MEAAERLYLALRDEFGFKDAKGQVSFQLKDFRITVKQNNIVGNIIEEWLDNWMTANNIPHMHNPSQSSPDFWLNTDNLESDWLEVKSFTGSPNFDVAAFRSFINLIIDKPYKLHSKHLLIKYKMEDGIVNIEEFWLKNLWEICCPSKKWPIKVQDKNKVIHNIRPATWYSDKTEFPVFQSLEHFLAAVEQTVYKYHDTNNMADTWLDKVCSNYKKYYGIPLNVPRWNDIKHLYSADF